MMRATACNRASKVASLQYSSCDASDVFVRVKVKQGEDMVGERRDAREAYACVKRTKRPNDASGARKRAASRSIFSFVKNVVA
jgi:hypothetical protein